MTWWCSQWTEEDEIADYERNCEWMDECLDGMFEKWFDKISQASVEDKRKVQISHQRNVFLYSKTVDHKRPSKFILITFFFK